MWSSRAEATAAERLWDKERRTGLSYLMGKGTGLPKVASCPPSHLCARCPVNSKDGYSGGQVAAGAPFSPVGDRDQKWAEEALSVLGHAGRQQPRFTLTPRPGWVGGRSP